MADKQRKASEVQPKDTKSLPQWSYFSMFSGIGGFELGIGDRGQCVGYSEIDKYAIKVYERSFNHENFGDATKIDVRPLPKFDLLVGGFPCQAFSVAGKRLGFADTRGTLFYHIARVLRNKRPRHFLLENVKGLLSHDSGKTFQTILGILTDLGYRVEWQILNSKDFGVPQNRERVFIIGHLRDKCERQILPFRTSHNPLAQKYVGSVGIPRLLDQTHLSRGHKQPQRVFEPSGISPTISSQETQGRYNITDRQSIQKDGVESDPKRKSGRSSHSLRIRRLTPTECERLQGFPDGWTALGIVGFETVNDDPYGKILYEYISDTQRYKLCGNAVTVNVATKVITALCNEGCLQTEGIS